MKGLFYQLLVFVTRFVASFLNEKHLYKSRMHRPDEIDPVVSSKLKDEASLLIGITSFNHILRVRRGTKRRELRNALVIAPTRGGKGLLAIPQILTWPHSIIINDIKGEMFRKTAGFRSTMSKVIVLDPTGVGHQYDPLNGKVTETDLTNAATNLLARSHDGEIDVFTARAITMLAQMFLAARMEEQSPLPYIRHLIYMRPVDIAKRLHTLSELHDLYPNLATRFLDTTLEHAMKNHFRDEFFLSAYSTLTNRINPLITDIVIRCFGGMNVTPEEIMCGEKPVTLYLRWPERDLFALSPLVQLLWRSFIDELSNTYDTYEDKGREEECNPVLLLIDEAGRTAIRGLADDATTVVGRGLSLWIAIQSLSQLDAVYGQHKADTLRNNMDTQIFYRQSSLETAEYIERRFGKKSEWAQSENKHDGKDFSQSLSEQGIPLVTALEATELDDEDILCLHHNRKFQARRMEPWRFSFIIFQ